MKPPHTTAWILVAPFDELAVAFTANPGSPNYAGRLTLDEVAACLSEACGHWGTGADYLLQTVAALNREGIHDPHLWQLQERVAGIIEARFPDRNGHSSQTEHDCREQVERTDLWTTLPGRSPTG